jgi:multidrug efflux pump subunit AcrA (membrane-fusion protein)
VTAGETLASLDPTALSESLSSAQSTLESNTAKLTEDANAQTSTATPTPSQGASTTPTTSPGASSGSSTSTQGTTTSATSTQVVKDQTALVGDQTTASNDQAQEAADLAQAQSTCATGPTTTTTTTTTPSTLPGSTPSTTPSSTSSCLAAMALVANDQQRVGSDESVVATGESNLARALSVASATAPASNISNNGSSGTGATSSGGNASSTSAAGSSGNSQNGTSSASDGASQIAADQAAIDIANANVTNAQQAVGEATLTSPIAGTVTSVGITSGESVSAGSSTETIAIVASGGYEVTGTLSTTQVPAVKVGDAAEVAVDGSSASLSGTLSQVGPVQTSSTGYSYPFVVALPALAHPLNDGSTATVSLNTGEAKNVLAVPTSAVITQGTQSFVLLISAGSTKERKIQTGIAGDIYTQVVAGLQQGESIVLADYADAVPSSNTTTGGFGVAGGTGGGFGGRAPATGVSSG